MKKIVPQAIGEKVAEVKENSNKKNRKKKKESKRLRKGINVDKSALEIPETDKRIQRKHESLSPLTTKSDSVANGRYFSKELATKLPEIRMTECFGVSQTIFDPPLNGRCYMAAYHSTKDVIIGNYKITPVDPISFTSQPPHPSPPQSPPHSPPQSPPFSPPHSLPPGSYEVPLSEGNISRSAEDSVQLKELMVLVPKLINRIGSFEKELKDTKQTLGNVVLKLVKKVKTLETALKRKSKKVLVSDSEGEESKDQGRKFQDIDDDPLVSLVRESMKMKSTDFGVSKEKSTDKGKRYRRRARSIAKKIYTGLDAEEEVNTSREEINTGIEEVSTGNTKVDSGTDSERGQREGNALIIELKKFEVMKRIKEDFDKVSSAEFILYVPINLKYGTNRPEDAYGQSALRCLRTMFIYLSLKMTI
ncbi:hypothetical protein Tco_0926499 [Tanacetum coccineum]|uniref:Uncharacterized protein n=1 Tax=Tanacetum coccineum TaxID=301880 RepID=A0ABQ5D9Z5_9ASTR